jgi:hypothetical protein
MRHGLKIDSSMISAGHPVSGCSEVATMRNSAEWHFLAVGSSSATPPPLISLD